MLASAIPDVGSLMLDTLCGLEPGAAIGAIGGGMGILVGAANPVAIGPILPPLAVRIMRGIYIWFMCDNCRSTVPVPVCSRHCFKFCLIRAASSTCGSLVATRR